MQKIHLVGTSHISQDSIIKIQRTIESVNPDIVAVELDKNRMRALKSNIDRSPGISSIRKLGFQGFLFALIGSWIQKKLGNIVRTRPGSDMLTAIQAAEENESRIALIDRDIEITMKRFSRHFGWKDKFNLLTDLIKGMISKKHRLHFDLSKVPPEEMIEEMISHLKNRYPGMYSVLVEERNIHMARNIKKIVTENPDSKIVVVVGAGHKKGLIEELHKIFKVRKPKEPNAKFH